MSIIFPLVRRIPVSQTHAPVRYSNDAVTPRRSLAQKNRALLAHEARKHTNMRGRKAQPHTGDVSGDDLRRSPPSGQSACSIAGQLPAEIERLVDIEAAEPGKDLLDPLGRAVAAAGAPKAA